MFYVQGTINGSNVYLIIFSIVEVCVFILIGNSKNFNFEEIESAILFYLYLSRLQKIFINKYFTFQNAQSMLMLSQV